jgi:hypothetical protein
MSILKWGLSILLALSVSGVQTGWAVEDLEKAKGLNPDEFNFKNVAQPNKQGEGGADGAVAPAPTSADQLTFDYRMAQERNKLYECLMLSASLVISLIIVLSFITKTRYTAANIVSASGLTFIIFGTIFIVILADAEAQLTASMGILGAITGYLFGTMRRGEGGEKTQEGKAPHEE